MKEKTLEEKYEMAKMMLMLIERITLAVLAGMVPMSEAPEVIRQVGNMVHIANHENGEHTFDCGPNRDEHHREALADYHLMYAAMWEDIKHGVDITDMYSKARGDATKGKPTYKEVDIDVIEAPVLEF